ncbi:MAG: hypothetical protein KatS3mg008_0440 [Acidimicrobiales bacterium]|nr:MAG: hypothetical protein KatS3mg008_0440 [Acidimicrobiales bacterium]
MSMWGPPPGSPFAGPTAAAQAASAGLPFAGVPPELADRVERILASEPEHPVPEVHFSHADWDRRPLNLRALVGDHFVGYLVAMVLVVLETVTLLAGPVFVQVGVDRGIVARDPDVLVKAAAAYIASVVANALLSGARVSWTGRLGEQMMYELRVRVFSHLQRLSLDFFTSERAGRLMTRMTSDIEALTQLLQDGLVNMAVQALTLVIVVAVLASTDLTLTVVLVVALVPTMTVFTLWFRRASDEGYRRVRDRIADVLADLQETLAGIRLIIAHNRRRHNVAQHQEILGEHLEANLYTARVGAIYGPGTEALGTLGQALVLVVGGNLVLDGRLTIGQLALFILYLTYFFAPIQQLVQLYNSYQQGQAAVRKLKDLLATEPTVRERPSAKRLPRISGEIRFERVTFGYEPGRPVLREVDLRIEPGETFALVGPTGAGKSTIAKLVVRFYDPWDGRVSVDGHDLRAVTIQSLRSQVGNVPQEPFLFHGTIRDNVAFARPDASDDEVVAACEAVGLADLLARLPEGLDTPVHERGVSLSSGERQLLALARVFLARPRVLVLDEATSSLDLDSERLVESAVKRLLSGRTAVVIAHRLSTAMRADRIAVVEDGRISEIGTHDQLVAAGGTYAELIRTWHASTR